MTDLDSLKALIVQEALRLGFSGTRIGPAAIPESDRKRLDSWLHDGFQGSMSYMERHSDLRKDPSQLVTAALTVISLRLSYWPTGAANAQTQLTDSNAAYISRYALGRDYHKVIRSRLQTLADRLTEVAGPFTYRVFTDSAPVMEVALASQSGLGWEGKHTLSLDRQGSWYFLGEIICDLPLVHDTPVSSHCGDCTRCIDHCPTAAITEPYRVDARRCLSYLTIENKGEIPISLRKALGNRIYGCDDCQLVCPWNRFAPEGDAEFSPRHQLDAARLLDLFLWDESEFLKRFEGSPIRRIGYDSWQRNIAVALGNSTSSPEAIRALIKKKAQSNPLVQEHIDWALAQLIAQTEDNY